MFSRIIKDFFLKKDINKRLTKITEGSNEKINTIGILIDSTYFFDTEKVVEEIKSMKYGIFVYTVNTIERARELLSWGVDCLCTDNIQDFSHLALELAD